MTCAHCGRAAKFHSYQSRRLLTVHGAVRVRRAYYYCGRCHQSAIPYDDALGITDEISPGLLPLVCLAGTLVPFADAAEDVLRRFAGVRVLPRSDDRPFSRPREAILQRDGNLISIYGGKLTTYRHIAEQAVDALRPQLGAGGREPIDTSTIRLGD